MNVSAVIAVRNVDGTFDFTTRDNGSPEEVRKELTANNSEELARNLIGENFSKATRLIDFPFTDYLYTFVDGDWKLNLKSLASL